MSCLNTIDLFYCSILFFLAFKFELVLNFKINYFHEDNTKIQQKLNFFNSFSKGITNDKILFKYHKKNGIYCEASKDLSPKEIAFQIPIKYIINECKKQILN